MGPARSRRPQGPPTQRGSRTARASDSRRNRSRDIRRTGQEAGGGTSSERHQDGRDAESATRKATADRSETDKADAVTSDEKATDTVGADTKRIGMAKTAGTDDQAEAGKATDAKTDPEPVGSDKAADAKTAAKSEAAKADADTAATPRPPTPRPTLTRPTPSRTRPTRPRPTRPRPSGRHESDADKTADDEADGADSEPLASAGAGRANGSSDAAARAGRPSTGGHSPASKARRARRSLWSTTDGDRADVTVSRPADNAAGDGD